MLVHCITLGDSPSAPTAALCGTLTFTHAQLSDVGAEITCEDCLLRLLARVHADMGALLRQLGNRVIELRNERKARERD